MVAYYHCKYLFRFKVSVDAMTLMSTENLRFEQPVVTPWLDIVRVRYTRKMVLGAEGQVGCEVVISDPLLVL